MEKYYGFADFKFTCGKGIYRHNTEILSAGLVICDSNYKICDTFYCTCKPLKNPVLTDKCIEITKLSQDLINSSPDSNDVMQKFMSYAKKYDLKYFNVWGDFDSLALYADSKLHKKAGFDNTYIKRASNKTVDIQRKILDVLGVRQQLSIETLSKVFNFEPDDNSFHNALTDAMGLYTIVRAVYTTDFKNNENFIALLNEISSRKLNEALIIDTRRQDYCKDIPMSEEEKALFDKLSENSDLNAKRHFILIRYCVIKGLKRHRNDENFLLVIRSEKPASKSIDVIPLTGNESFNPDRLGMRSFRFNRSEYQNVILKELSAYTKNK